MPAANQIRAEIEAILEKRIPSALTKKPRVFRPKAATGIAALDECLGEGIPLGAISEIIGDECSGRTTIALTILSQFTSLGKVCAWVDVSDTLHPASVAAAGIDLNRLLWIRCGGAIFVENQLTSSLIKQPQKVIVNMGGNSPHPRDEIKGLPAAINELLSLNKKYKQHTTIGTPGAPNQRFGSTETEAKPQYFSAEQLASDRQPARRGDLVLKQKKAYEPPCYESIQTPRRLGQHLKPLLLASEGKCNTADPIYRLNKPWSRIDQALKVADLLIQAGGFSAIVLDMSSIAPEFASRIPPSTWFRYRAAAERTQSSILLLTQSSCAKSAAGIALRLNNYVPVQAEDTIFTGLRASATLERSHLDQDVGNVVPICKPPQRVGIAEWHSKTAWSGHLKIGF